MEIEDLILSGAVEVAGIDPNTGEMLYNFTDKLKDVSPILHREVSNAFNAHVTRLWELDMIDMDITSENPMVRLTKKAFHPAFLSRLDEDEKYTLQEIKRNLIRE